MRRICGLVAALLLLTPGIARAGHGVGTTVRAQAVDALVQLDPGDDDAFVSVSTAPTWNPDGSPTGTLDGFCSWFAPGAQAGTEACSIDRSTLRPGVAYWWWLTVRHEGGAAVDGPYAFTLKPALQRTKAQAATLPSGRRWTGRRSIKDTLVTDAIYRTMKLLGAPRTLAVACWTNDDFTSVLGAEGVTADDGDSYVTGIWFAEQPRWLHLRGSECTDLQRLVDTKAATGKGAYGLSNALHETMHAYGVRDEAETNCLAVQLVPYAALELGLPWSRSLYLGQLALRYVRNGAPRGYWNAGKCRDGGAWDVDTERKNLS